ncbi:hypothetical protein ACO1O0_008425 [Amphichorda felina]
MAAKTYLLAPDFTYKPTGPIQLGALIADPFRPTKVLSLPPTPPQDIDTAIQRDHHLSRTNGHSFNISLWAQFLSSLGPTIGTSTARDATTSYSIDVLETRRLASIPLDGDDPLLRARLAEPRVRAAMRAGLYGRAPVYLVTGVKLARGLSVRTEAQRSVGGSVGTSLPIGLEAVGVTAGAEVGTERRAGMESSFRGAEGEDVVFAYQVHVVKRRGWSGESVTVDGLHPREGLLHDEEEQEQKEDESAVIVPGTVEDLQAAAEDLEMELKSEELVDDEGNAYVCIKATDLEDE